MRLFKRLNVLTQATLQKLPRDLVAHRILRGADAGADGGADALRPGAELRHGLYGVRGHPAQRAFPARVGSADHARPGVFEQDRVAVGSENT